MSVHVSWTILIPGDAQVSALRQQVGSADPAGLSPIAGASARVHVVSHPSS